MAVQMSDEEFRDLWGVIMGIARTSMYIPQEDLQRLSEVISAAHAIGPMVDPTAYRNGMNNLDDQAIILKGFKAFRAAIEEVKEKATARK